MDQIKGLNKNTTLFIYLTAIFIFGILFFNNIPGTISLICTFLIGRSLMSSRFGIYWSLSLAAGFLPHYHLKTDVLSSWIFLLIFFSIYFLFIYYRDYELKNKKYYYITIAGLLTGISIPFIGPYAIILILLSWISFNLVYNNIFKLDIIGLFLFLTTSIVFVFSWSYYIYIVDNIEPIESIIGQLKLFRFKLRNLHYPLVFYILFILVGYFPSSIFIYKAFRPQATDSPEMKMFKSWMVILLLFGIGLFLIADIRDINLNSIACFPITFLCAYVLDHLHRKTMDFSKVLKSIYLFNGVLTSILFLFVHYQKLFISTHISGKTKSASIYSDLIKLNESWSYYDSLIGLLLFIVICLGFRWLKRGHISYATITTCSVSILICMYLLNNQ